MPISRPPADAYRYHPFTGSYDSRSPDPGGDVPQARFRAVQDASRDSFTLWDAVRDADGALVDFTLAYANAAFERMFGGATPAPRGARLLTLFPTAAAAGRFARYARVLETGETDESLVEYEVDGRWFRLLAARAGDGVGVTVADVTAQVEAERVLRCSRAELERLVVERTRELGQSEERFRSLTENASDAITILDADGTLRYASQAYERVFGYRLDAILGESVFALLHPDDRDAVQAVFARLLSSPGATQVAEFRVRRGDGGEAWVQATGQNRLADPAVRGIVVNSRDVTAQRMAAEASQRADAMFRVALDGMLDGFFVLRAVRDTSGAIRHFALVEANSAGEAMIGTALDDARGLGLLELLPLARESGLFELLRAAVDRGERFDGDYRPRDARIAAAWLWLQVIPMPDGAAITVRDITEGKQAYAAARELAHRDELTGLLNRRGFRELAEHERLVARRHGRRDGIVSLDLSGFKRVNDSWGHAEGDRALAALARVLRATVREVDLVARMGGDEFVVYAVALFAEGEADLLVRRLLDNLAQDNAREIAAGRPYAITTGIGVTEVRGGEELDDALARADAALYTDKARRRPGAVDVCPPAES